MRNTLNILYGVSTGMTLIYLVMTAMVTASSKYNLFSYPRFWVGFIVLAGVSLYLDNKRKEA